MSATRKFSHSVNEITTNVASRRWKKGWKRWRNDAWVRSICGKEMSGFLCYISFTTSLPTSLSRICAQKSPQMTSIDVLFIKIQSNCFSIPVNAPLTPSAPFQAKNIQNNLEIEILQLPRPVMIHSQELDMKNSPTSTRREQMKSDNFICRPLLNLWVGVSLVGFGRKHSRCGDGICTKKRELSIILLQDPVRRHVFLK